MDQYIIMKASRSPSNLLGIARIENAYHSLVFDNVQDAVRIMFSLTKANPVGYRVWEVSSTEPIYASVESYFNNKLIPIPEKEDE